MKKLILLVAALFMTASCGNWANTGTERDKKIELPSDGLSDLQELSLDKMRYYCQGCHGVGALRFIYSDDNSQVWEDLFVRRAPNSGKIWADAIIEVINWPNGIMPGFDEMLNYPDRDWMPKGVRRVEFSTDSHGDKAVRELIIEVLKEG